MCIVLPLPNLLKGLEIMNEKISMKDRNLPTGWPTITYSFLSFFMQWDFRAETIDWSRWESRRIQADLHQGVRGRKEPLNKALPFLAHPLAAKKLSFALIHYWFRKLKLTSFSISLFFFLFSRPANQQALTRPSIFWLTILSSTYSPLIFFRTLFLFPEMEDLINQWGNGGKNNTGFTDSRPRRNANCEQHALASYILSWE